MRSLVPAVARLVWPVVRPPNPGFQFNYTQRATPASLSLVLPIHSLHCIALRRRYRYLSLGRAGFLFLFRSDSLNSPLVRKAYPLHHPHVALETERGARLSQRLSLSPDLSGREDDIGSTPVCWPTSFSLRRRASVCANAGPATKRVCFSLLGTHCHDHILTSTRRIASPAVAAYQ